MSIASVRPKRVHFNSEISVSSPVLFSPYSIGGVTLPNRIVVSPMGMHSATDGLAGDFHLMHLGQFAVAGVGLLITEAVAVEPVGRVSRGCLGIWSDDHVAAFARVLDFCRQYGGAKLGIQLGHSGRKGSVGKSWEGQKAVPPEAGGWSLVGPSPSPYPGRAIPMEADRETLAALRRTFADAARRSATAGFDLIEIHAAHGYLLHNFLSPLVNKRIDGYGGSLANRMRFPLEIFSAVRDAFPAGKVVGVRISATDWVNDGWSVEDTLTFCAELKARGCDYICASSGGTAPEQVIPVAPLYQVPFARRIRNDVGIPTMAVGLINKGSEAEEVLVKGDADLIALGRALLFNPRWAWQAASELGAEAYFPPQYDRAHPSMRNSAAFNVMRER